MNKNSAYIQLFLAMAIVGSTIVVSKLIADKFPTFFGTSLTLVVAFIGVAAIYFYQNKRVAPTKNEWKYLVLQALTGVVLFRVLSFYSLKVLGVQSFMVQMFGVQRFRVQGFSVQRFRRQAGDIQADG